MKVIVTHISPDLDAITSVWLLKRFLNGWEDAIVKYVPAGDRINLSSEKISPEDYTEAIERIGDDEVIHVDTGLGALDHHQTQSDKVCGASLTFDYVRNNSKMKEEKVAAVSRMIDFVVLDDHFKQVFRSDADSDYHEFELDGVLEGLKYQHPGQDQLYVDFIMNCLDAVMHNFENRIWAEKEISEQGEEFALNAGKSLAIETLNDSVIKLAQLKGFSLVIRKDPRNGNARIKASPKADIDLTPAYEELRKKDPSASWFLHVGKRMLLNGTSKNTKMIPTKLTLNQIVDVIKSLYS